MGEDAKLLSSVLPLPSSHPPSPLSPLPCFHLSTVGHGRFFVLCFSASFTSSHCFSQRHGKKPLTHRQARTHTHTHTHTQTHAHTTQLSGCQICRWVQSNPIIAQLEGVPWQCRTDGHKEQGGWRVGWELLSELVLSPQLRLLTRREREGGWGEEREDGLSVSQQSTPSEGGCLACVVPLSPVSLRFYSPPESISPKRAHTASPRKDKQSGGAWCNCNTCNCLFFFQPVYKLTTISIIVFQQMRICIYLNCCRALEISILSMATGVGSFLSLQKGERKGKMSITLSTRRFSWVPPAILSRQAQKWGHFLWRGS